MPFNFFPFRKKSKSEQNLKEDENNKTHEDDNNSNKKKGGFFRRHKSSNNYDEDKDNKQQPQPTDKHPEESSNGHSKGSSSKEPDNEHSETPHKQPSEPATENASEDVKNAGTSSTSNKSGQATENNNEAEVKKSKEEAPVQYKRRPREMKFQAIRVEELPKDLKKIARSSRIPDEILDKDFEILLNILHFVTKKVEKEKSAAKDLQQITDKKVTTSDTPPKTTATTDKDPKIAKRSPKDLKSSSDPQITHQNPENNRNNNNNTTENDNDAPKTEPAEPKPDETKPTETKPDETKPDEAKPDETKPTETKPDETKPTETKPDDTKPDEAKPDEAKPAEAKKAENKPQSRQSRNLSAAQWDPYSLVITNKNPKDLFKSLKKSGKGGFGTVFAAKRITDGKKVAIKRMNHATAKEKMDNYSEARYTKMCDHPNIVKIVDCYEWKEEFWLVLEFLEGGTLTEARRGHDFEEKEIAYVARELLKGLAYLHSINLVHRDVKSENIMMSIMGDIKLIDFGLCSDVSLIRPSMVGSPYWMPPEMLQRNPHSYPCDIWSFGISILELANKNPPNAQNKIKVMFTTATQGCPQPFDEPERWSNRFKDFISRCLVKDPAKRSTAADLLKHPFLDQAADTRKVMQKILSEIFLQKAIGLM